MRFPAFMFWPERYWLDAYDLSDAEHGVYLRLLLLQWNAPNCKLPNDDAWLAAKMQRPLTAVGLQVRPIITRFFTTDGNWIWQRKLRDEFDRLCRLSQRGTAANKARWNNNKIPSQSHPTLRPVGYPKKAAVGGSPPSVSANHLEIIDPDSVGPTPTPTKERVSCANGAHGLNGHLADFERFYQPYPLHKGRGQAERAFVAAIKVAPIEDIVAGAERYSAECVGREPRYIKHPATWLNGKCWLDEASAPEAPKNPHGGALL